MAGIIQILQYLMPSPMEIAISLLIIGLGAGFIPLLAWFKALRPKGFLGRILWTIGAINTGPYGLVQNKNGGYDLLPVTRSDDGELFAVDGEERIPVEEVPENWSRLGKQPFLITYRKDERLFRDVLSDVGEAMADGGIDGQRGGYASYIPEGSNEGYVIRIHRLLERLREAGGSRLGDIAQQEGLREFGGDQDMSNMVMIGYVSSMAILGLAAGIYLFG